MTCLFWLMTTAVIAGDLDLESLRKLAKLPELEMFIRFPFMGNELASFLEPRRRGEVQKLREELEANGADVERWRRLAELHGLLHDDQKAREAAAKAADLYRGLLEKSPEDPALLAGLGESLQRAGNDEEAGAVLRKAV